MEISFLAEHDFALIDRVAIDDLPDDLEVLAIVPLGLENDAHLLPWLLPLKALTDDQQATLLEQHSAAAESGQTPWLSTLLACDLPADKLRSHLAARLILKLGSSGKALLRYYDPRVFMQLQWMLNPEQQQALYGPIRHWSVFLDGQWQQRPAPKPVKKYPAWVFDAPSSARLERIGLINQTITSLKQSAPADRDVLGRLIDRFLIRAKDQYRLVHDEDCIAFAQHALLVHPDFDRHRTIQTMIHSLAAKQTTYRDATALYDKQAWQQIAKEITSEGNLRT